VSDDRPFALLDHVRQDGERGRQAGVPVRENVDRRTFLPRHVGCVDGLFDICAVKIEWRDLYLGERATSENVLALRDYGDA